jgi:hypothetical protein
MSFYGATVAASVTRISEAPSGACIPLIRHLAALMRATRYMLVALHHLDRVVTYHFFDNCAEDFVQPSAF